MQLPSSTTKFMYVQKLDQHLLHHTSCTLFLQLGSYGKQVCGHASEVQKDIPDQQGGQGQAG